MAEERTIAISSTSRIGADEVARKTFATARRGFEPTEVRAFLEDVARELTAASEREEQMRKQVADAEERAAHPVLDEDMLTTALGEETARVLRAAREAANDVVHRAEAESSELIQRAEQRESQSRADAERAAAEQASTLQAERDRVRREAEQDALALGDAARHEAEEMIEHTRTECRSMVQQAQELRTKVLTDLTNRRRVLHLQIEQLRAGRERLSEAIQEVRLSVDHIADDLLRAEDEARVAAEAAGRSAAGKPDPDLEQELENVTSRVGVHEAARPAGTSAPGESVAVVITDERVETTDGSPDAGEEAAAGPVTDTAQETASAKGPKAPEAAENAPQAASGHDQLDDLFAKLRAADPSEPVDVNGSNGSSKHEPSKGSGELDPSEDDPGVAAATLERSEDLLRRDELLRPVISGLSRRVKRALQDDQNAILDRIRSLGGWKQEVMPDLDEHNARYVGAATDMLAEASRAGATFAGSSLGSDPDVSSVAEELVADLVGPLRRRLEDGGPNVDPSDEAALIEHVGAAFREWRGDRTDRLAGDHATTAFSAALIATLSPDASVRWIVDDEGAPCADCEDNALAENVRPGDEFPTGHRHPPVHSGCRCLLILSEPS